MSSCLLLPIGATAILTGLHRVWAIEVYYDTPELVDLSPTPDCTDAIIPGARADMWVGDGGQSLQIMILAPGTSECKEGYS